MSWRTYLTDLAGETLSELAGASGKTVAVPLRSMATAGVTVRLDHDDADELLEGDTLLKVVEELDDEDAAAAVDAGFPVNTDGHVLHFHGRQITAEEVAQTDKATVAATWADPMWTLFRRLCGKSATGYANGSSTALVDIGAIISDLVDTANTEAPTDLVMGDVATSSSTYVSGWFFKPVAEAVAELTGTLYAPDWRVRPIDYVPSSTPGLGIIGELDVLPAIGQAQPDAVFEYGDGLLNATSYQRVVSMDGVGNRWWHLPTGYPDSSAQQPLSRDDTVSQARRGLLEGVAVADLTADALRTALLNAYIAVRADPRQTITFTAARELKAPGRPRRVPKFGVDYGIGDAVTFRASIHRGADLSKRIDALVRVYQFSATIGDDGIATPNLTVNPT